MSNLATAVSAGPQRSVFDDDLAPRACGVVETVQTANAVGMSTLRVWGREVSNVRPAADTAPRAQMAQREAYQRASRGDVFPPLLGQPSECERGIGRDLGDRFISLLRWPASQQPRGPALNLGDESQKSHLPRLGDRWIGGGNGDHLGRSFLMGPPPDSEAVVREETTASWSRRQRPAGRRPEEGRAPTRQITY